MTIWSKRFWLDAGERALKAFAGGIVTGFGSNAVDLHVFQATAVTVLVRSALLAVVSVLMSIASSKANGLSPASIAPPGA